MTVAKEKLQQLLWKVPELSDNEFMLFKNLMYTRVGIALSNEKKRLIVSRLLKRLRILNVKSFKKYFDLIKEDKDEMQLAIDLLTTNETYFFREKIQFDYVIDHILPNYQKYSAFNLWSAASSTGEEAYSASMILAEYFGLGGRWQVLGTDINTDVIRRATEGLYPSKAAENIPHPYLVKYCLKGVRSNEGTLLMNRMLKHHTKFKIMNLIEGWPSDMRHFDIIFLRNVMIYFDKSNRQKLVGRIAQRLNPRGYLIIGQSESLNSISSRFKLVAPSIYQRID